MMLGLLPRRPPSRKKEAMSKVFDRRARDRQGGGSSDRGPDIGFIAKETTEHQQGGDEDTKHLQRPPAREREVAKEVATPTEKAEACNGYCATEQDVQYSSTVRCRLIVMWRRFKLKN
jgi:hypothetical protein